MAALIIIAVAMALAGAIGFILGIMDVVRRVNHIERGAG